MAESSLDRLEDLLGRPFDDRSLIARALAHRSFCAENPTFESNERLEFLGDAVLGLVVTDYIYRAFPHLPEGELAKVRASVVNAGVLAELATEIELGTFVLLGKGEGLSGGREKPSILADAMEAVLAATYLDGGWDAAYKLVMALLGERIAAAAEGPGGQDYKTRLQELAARRFDQMPRYEVRDEGPDHAKRFYANVLLQGTPRGRGEGRSKKQAEQAAARMAWEWLRDIEAEAAAVAAAEAAEAAAAAIDPGPPSGPSPDDAPSNGSGPVSPGEAGASGEADASGEAGKAP
ncbi:MAG: ribonuclease [Actinomycetota bacterium]|nr:ribonuclease [Actinomycetota bacterium]